MFTSLIQMEPEFDQPEFRGKILTFFVAQFKALIKRLIVVNIGFNMFRFKNLMASNFDSALMWPLLRSMMLISILVCALNFELSSVKRY